jgi:predicted PurR-regulated permease PerM
MEIIPAGAARPARTVPPPHVGPAPGSPAVAIDAPPLAAQAELPLEKRFAGPLLDVLIRVGLLAVLALLCYQVFAPFLPLMVWAIILAITLYPLHRVLTRRMGGRGALSATVITLLGIALIIAPAALLLASTGDSVQRFVQGVQDNTLQVPPPRESVASWPVVGKKVHGLWERAHADLPGLVRSMQPKIGDLARSALSMVASIGGGILKFIAAFIVAGIVMGFGEAGARACRAIFARVFGSERGEQFTVLSVGTVRSVALGVIGIAFIQALAVGLCLLVADVPLAGVLAGVVLVLGIAQVPALIVTIPAIVYFWTSGNYSNGAAIAFTVVLFVAGMLDNVLKPLMLGRGVDAPMPVILLGALGGLATGGILGLFVGATLLALGYQIFMSWVNTNPDLDPGRAKEVETPLVE